MGLDFVSKNHCYIAECSVQYSVFDCTQLVKSLAKSRLFLSKQFLLSSCFERFASLPQQRYAKHLF